MTSPTHRIRGWLKAALREPLTHFLIAGLALFLFFGWRGNDVDPASRTITIDEAKVGLLAAQWQQTWQRPPTPREIDALIRDYIKEEIYTREAVRLGLDRDDIVIRRRLRNKMEFLARAAVENANPTDATLQKWLDSHRNDYATGAQVSFDQIYLGEADPAVIAARAKSAMTRLKAGTGWQSLGDRISLPKSMDKADSAAIAREFGDDFAKTLSAMPTGSWTGPVGSGFGAHLVRIRNRVEGKVAPLSAVHQQVENDWRSATEKQREDRAYQALLDGYTIRIAKP